MKALKINENGLTLVVGKVKEIIEGRGKAAGRCKTLRIETTEWDSSINDRVQSIYEIGFWNSSDPMKAQLCDRLEKLNPQVGMDISVSFYPSDGEYKGNAVNFKTRGLWSWENGKRNMVIGTVIRTREFDFGGEKSTSVTIPYDEYVNREKKTVFLGVNFNDKFGKQQQSALKLLSPDQNGNKKKAIIMCGEIQTNAKGFVNAYGNGFELM